jgi:two-component system response regulator PilR (NtrC family)
VARILIVDDERSMREFLQILLEGEGHAVEVSESVAAARARCEASPPELVFLDLRLPDGSGMDLLHWLRDHDPECQVIMMTAFATTENAVEAMRAGAYDYQLKPFKVDEIRALTGKALEKHRLLRENRELRAQLRSAAPLERILGRSPRMTELIADVVKVSQTRTSVLIEGESGTGKELIARAIHELGARSQGPFVAVNCGAIPEALIESELFGHVAGAFTGASRARPGLFRAAAGGTLLLDEVSELPAPMQVKLLRALEDRRVRAVGDDVEHSVDVRILAASNRELQGLVQEGKFREDLFYRLHVVCLRVPPLRERVEDIPLLARAFVAAHGEEVGKPIAGLEPAAIRALTAYPFPGNVRELQNFIERAVALANGPTIRLDDLPAEVRGAAGSPSADLLSFPDGGLDLEARLREVEGHFISAALSMAGGVRTRAAALLGLSFRSLRYRLHKLGLTDARDDDAGEDPE